AAPVIVTQPANVTVFPGQMATLTVSATGPQLNYQWYQGLSGDTRTPASNGTSATFTTPPLTNTTSYWVQVYNVGNSVDSSTAITTVVTLMLNASPPPLTAGN